MADYILNMGGIGSDYSNTVDVFHVTENGVEHIADHGLSLSTAQVNLAAASCGNYILAMGGNDSNSLVNTVDVFKVTANGVEAVADHGLSLSTERNNLAAASCGNYILAMGGYDGNDYSNTVDVFHVTENGVEHIADHGLSLSTARGNLAAASCGNYILAMGGLDAGNDISNTVDVFHVTENGVEHIADHGLSLSTARASLVAASCGNYILAMGGLDAGSFLNTVDVFKVTANGVEAVADHGLSLSTGRGTLAAASCGNYILAMGGYDGSFVNTVDVFKVTANGVEAVADHGLSLSTARRELSAAACGNYILAMGGYNGSDYLNTVDVFQIFN